LNKSHTDARDEFILHDKQNINLLSSFPIFINVNKKTFDSYGILFFNSGPIEAFIKDDGAVFKFVYLKIKI
jgi:hypothetical protein